MTGCAIAPLPPPALTLEKYDRIESGMTLEKVEEILGVEGVSLSETEIAGIRSAVYEFKESDRYHAITVTISDGKIVSKAQYGLK